MLPLIIVVCFFGYFSCLYAQEKIEIVNPELIKIPVAVPEFDGPLPLSREMASIARHDLELHLLFNVLGEGLHTEETNLFASLGVDWLIKGKISLSGNHLQSAFYLTDMVKGKTVLARGFRGPKSSARYMVHRFVDLAVKEMLGVPGVAMSRVVFVERKGLKDTLFVQDFDGHNPIPLISGELILSPRLSSDGRKVAFVYYQNNRSSIQVIDLTTGKRHTVCQYPGLNASPAWHPDGNKLVVTLSKDGTIDLYLIDLNGKILRRLTHGEGINTGASFSPDGNYLAFVSDRTGRPQIYIMDLITRGVRRLTFKGRYNTSPCWSPAGDRIVYASLKGRVFSLFTIDPEGGEPIQITSGQTSFEAPYFAPNGRLILAQGSDGLYLFLVNGAAKMHYREGKILFPSWAKLR
ncbi:PD40 domain-containing protein [Thermodesulfatator autotrophicus]|uniref:PD40 domain-containing protein n=1 Tax=Thermodesulfatator autotrophicus TaxID=1795632 RepID=UPI0018D39535|nr:PD40 domain-containing protein [Thermodesulfatator autotrophicus]